MSTEEKILPQFFGFELERELKKRDSLEVCLAKSHVPLFLVENTLWLGWS